MPISRSCLTILLAALPLMAQADPTTENIPDPVRAILANEYPHDHATGYELGQVRGAVTIKQPVGTAQ